MQTLRVIHQVFRGYISKPFKLTPDKARVIPFRCWPVDIDVYLHMNNSKYLVGAELARWRSFPPSDLMSRAFTKRGFLFLAAENNLKYHRPINPMQKYVISTKISVDEGDKYLYYEHSFLEHPDDTEDDPKLFAIVELKAVCKENNGKTIKPSELLEDSEYLREWVTKEID
jgi:acyl-CoA thioesterase FadM